MKKIILILFLILGIVYGATINESEPNNNYTEANNITINDTGIGNLYYISRKDNDISDWWKFIPADSGILHIYTTGATKNIDAELYDKNPNYYYPNAYDYSYNSNIDITVNVTKDKTYYLGLFYDDYYTGSTDYQLHFEFTPVDANISTNERDFTLRKQFNIKGDYKMVGNGVLCVKANGQCIDVYEGQYPAPNNDVTLSYINTLGTDTITVNDKNVTVLNASKADVSGIPDDAKIVWVGFYTQGDRTDNISELESRLILNPSYLIAPNGDKYKITPSQIDILQYDYSLNTFSTFAEVKDLEGKSGSYFNGWWTGVNIQTQEGANTALGFFGAWNMVVVYEDNGLHLKNISVFDGYKKVANSDVIIDINGFLTPFHGTVNSKMSVFVGEGDAAYTGDQLLMKDSSASNYTNVNEGTAEENNAFDSSVNGFETDPSNTNKYGIDIHNYNVGTDGLEIIKNGDTSASIKLTTNGDVYFPNVVVFATDLYEPRVCYYIDKITDNDGNVIFENGGFVKDAKINPDKEYNVTIWISNMKKDANDTDIEDAKDVKVFMTSKDFNYTNSSTYMKNIGWDDYQHQTDANDSDLFTYLPDNNESDYHVGVGANGDQGGEVDVTTFDDVSGRAYIDFLGKFIVEKNSTTIDLNQTFKFKASFETASIKITDNNAEPIDPCVDLNTIGSVYIPNPGSFNVVENSFNASEDPTDVNDPLNQIYTKIVNKNLNMKILSLDNDYKTLKVYNGLLEIDLINNPNSESECASNSALKSYFVSFDSNSSIFNFEYNKTVRDGRFRIKYLTDGNGNIIESTACTSKTYNCVWGLLTQIATDRYGDSCPTQGGNTEDCDIPCADVCNYHALQAQQAQQGNDTNDSIAPDACLECLFNYYSSSVCSRDDFAIRPYEYKIRPVSGKFTAGEDTNLSIEALDYNGNVINDFNFANAPVELNITDAKGCITGNVTKPSSLQTKVNFVNGVANLTFNYSEAGDLNISVKEYKNGNEYAKVDENDSVGSGGLESDDVLLVGKGTSTVGRFYPARFDINGTFNNFENSAFTYLSNDLNMSSELNLTITAVNAEGNITKNYNKNCYAENFDVNISYPSLGADINKTVHTVFYDLNNSGEYNKSINSELNLSGLLKDWFIEGVAHLPVKIDFDKNYTNYVHPFGVSVLDINVSDANGTFGGNGYINGNSVLFLYGRIKVSNAASYGNSVKTIFEYQYWTDTQGWLTSTGHINGKFGHVNEAVTDAVLPNGVSMNLGSIVNGKQNVVFDLDTDVQQLPYSAKIHLGISSWLWYFPAPLGKPYKDPSSVNTDCMTHPCMKVDFLKSGTGWGGPGKEGTRFSEGNRTSNINTMRPDINTSKSQVNKINW